MMLGRRRSNSPKGFILAMALTVWAAPAVTESFVVQCPRELSCVDPGPGCQVTGVEWPEGYCECGGGSFFYRTCVGSAGYGGDPLCCRAECHAEVEFNQ